ncbi:E domain-containing protein [Staphylococcus debuckii]|uniref:E domain-containing protein n=1 Tax=Staphylococcus debuckii TaxID=2044912 RepID=UPI000F438C30|nr:E domain-containing protein [Staphylococcus debuckii]AYU54291.1 LPXTG cell wall anchor domain-containing protein [Staphylococcus debuckii]
MDEFDPNVPAGETQEVPGKPGVKNPVTGEVVTPPVDTVIKHGPVEGTPEVTNEPIPHTTQTVLDPKMTPGSEDKVVQEGKDGVKKTTTPIFKNPLTGEKVGEGTPVVETTPPVNEIINYAPEEIAPGTRTEFDPNLPAGEEEVTPGVPGLKDPKTGEIIKDPIDKVVKKGGDPIPNKTVDEFDPNVPAGETQEVPGKPGVKNPVTGEVVTPPVDTVIKHGPVEGTPEVTNEPIPHTTQTVLDPKMTPGSEDKVVQEGKDGNKKTTTPIFKNPLTGEKVGEGTPVVETTTPVNEIINYAPEEIAPGTRTEFDPNLPAGEEEVTPGVPGLKDPKTGEIIKDPIDEVVKKGGDPIPNKTVDEFDPNVPAGETQEVPGKPGVKNPITGEVVTPPVNTVIKHGPVEGDAEVTEEVIPHGTKSELDPKMTPGSENKVVQEGKDGVKKTTTPTLVNPLTKEVIGKGEPKVEITPPVDEIINYAPEEIAPGTRTEFDPNLPAGQEKVTPGVPGLKDPKTGEIIKDPIDEVVKKGGDPIPNKTVDEFDPNLPKGETKVIPGKPGLKDPKTGKVIKEPIDKVIKHGGKESKVINKDKCETENFKINKPKHSEVPTTPEQPAISEKLVTPETPTKPAKATPKHKNVAKALPKTGESKDFKGLGLAALFGAAGLLVLFRRKL